MGGGGYGERERERDGTVCLYESRHRDKCLCLVRFDLDALTKRL